MRKIFWAIALLGLLSCKKETLAKEATTQDIPVEDASSFPTATGNEELIAKANPLTNVALAQSHYDFGKIKKGDKVEHVFEITNTGENPLIITEVKPACGCTAPTYTKDPILPGKKGQVVLSFDSSSFDGIVNKTAEVFANVEKAPITLSFSADIQP